VAGPGDLRSYQPEFRNSGDDTAVYVAMWLTDDQFAHFTTRYSNCRYQPDVAESLGYCEFKLDLAPGETARVTADTAITVKIQPDAPIRSQVYSAYFLDVYDSPVQGDFGDWGDGPELKLEKLSGGGAAQGFGDADSQ
jgi:hypothetical protein